MNNKKMNNKGVALVTVVLFFLVLVILLGGVMFSSLSNQGNAMLSKEHSSSYYVAESGLNISMEKLMDYLNSNGYDNITSGYATKMSLLNDYILSLNMYSTTGLNGFSGNLTGVNPSGSYSITTSSPAENLYEIRSVGLVNGVERVVVTTFDIDPILVEQAKAILTKGTIDVKNSTIIGPIASLFDLPGSYIDISCNGSTSTEINEFFVPVGTDIDSVSFGSCDAPDFAEAKPVPDEVVFNDVVLPTYYDSGLKTVVSNNGTYTFNLAEAGVNGFFISSLPTANVTFNLVGGASTTEFNVFVGAVDGNSFANVGDIDVTGNGKLRLMVEIDPVFKTTGKKTSEVEATFSWGGYVNISSLTLEKPQLDKFQLIIKSASLEYDSTDKPFTIIPTFSISNSGKFVGSVIMDRVNVDIGNVEYKGFIATQGELVEITSTSDITGPMWIYAPDADFKAQTPILIEGSIISSTATFSAGGTLKYEQYTGDVPSLIDIPDFSGGEPVPVGITVKFINFKEV